MKIVLSDSRKVGQFGCILRHLKNISSNIEMLINERRLYVQGMDSSHASLFELHLQSHWFSEYKVEKNYNLGINCALVFKIINCLEDTQTITLEYDDGDHLYITLNPRDGERSIIKKFQLPLVMMENELLTVTDTEYSVDLRMISSEFSTLIDQLIIFGNDLVIKCTEESIELTGQGEMGKMNAIIKEENILIYAIEEDCKLTLSFSMRFIQQFAMFSKVNMAVNIHLCDDSPMKIQFDMDDVLDVDDEDDDYTAQNYIRFYLAPKIEDF